MDPPIEDLLDKVDSKFTLVALGASRARQVNAYYNSLGEGLGRVVPPQVTTVSGKPLSIAFEEVAAGKATYTVPTPRKRKRGPSRSSAPGRPRGLRRHRRLQGGGGVPAAGGRRGARVAGPHGRGARGSSGEATFSALASEPARTSLWEGSIPHTELGQSADLVLVAPATAHLLARYAAGMADDLLTATLLATRAPVVVCPAMHTEMWEHPAVRDNLSVLRRRGVVVVPPEEGRLAGGDVGAGRLAEPAAVVDRVLELLAGRGDLAGVAVAVSAGGTREPLDPVRYLTNRSSGKQGHALAGAAARRGASGHARDRVAAAAARRGAGGAGGDGGRDGGGDGRGRRRRRRGGHGGGGGRLPAEGPGRAQAARPAGAGARAHAGHPGRPGGPPPPGPGPGGVRRRDRRRAGPRRAQARPEGRGPAGGERRDGARAPGSTTTRTR